MVPLGAALALIPKFNSKNSPLADWVERLGSVARLFQVSTMLFPDLATDSLQKVTKRALPVLPSANHTTLAQIVARLECLHGKVTLVAELPKIVATKAKRRGDCTPICGDHSRVVEMVGRKGPTRLCYHKHSGPSILRSVYFRDQRWSPLGGRYITE